MRKPKWYYSRREYRYYELTGMKEPWFCEGCKRDCNRGHCKSRRRAKSKKSWKYYRNTQYKEVQL